MSLMMLSMIFVMITMSAASGRRIVEVLNEVPDMANPDHPETNIADGSIDFNHVDFSYKHGSGEKTFQDLDLHIASGETVGIIGGTGCGKSSLVSLVSRLYDVDSGSVCVGGKDVRSYDMEALRNQVAVVLQKNVLFSGTILDTLRWGKEDATQEECAEACRQACADEFIHPDATCLGRERLGEPWNERHHRPADLEAGVDPNGVGQQRIHTHVPGAGGKEVREALFQNICNF